MEGSNTGNGAIVARSHPAFVKGTTVVVASAASSIVLLGILGVVAVSGIISSVVVTTRDGYRRMPKESFARTV